MAERRMFSKPLTSSDLFLEMPKDAQLLYFHLALDADDDGFINSPNKIIRCVGCQKSDMEVLIKKGYLKLFESGIAVIVHWKIHNYIQKDRYKETIYQKEKQQLVLYGKKYVTKDEYTQSVSNEDTSCVSILETQDRLDKNNEEQNRLELDGILEKIENKKVREKSDIPLCFMTYLNVVFHYGYDEFFKKCQEVGIDGIILPDLPYEESQEVKDVCYNYDVTLISMIAPTSKDRVEMIAKEAKGFIYLVSSMGVTGTRDNTSFASNLEEIIEHIHQVTDTPVAIGFGINKPEQVKEFKQYADGVIVGSAIVNIIKEHGNHADLPLREYIQSLTKEL
jgi:tryptophan synthase alpha chain